MLDLLKIDKVIVYTISGGGPTGLHFASRHPDKTIALISTCAISLPWGKELSGCCMKRLMTNECLNVSQTKQWLKNPDKSMILELVQMEATYDKSEIAKEVDKIMNDKDTFEG
jgi:pimeloyl-ACP methyl ester carboxylesterase